jgi:nucleoside-diphosphate-sugar epimerase
MTAKRVVFTGGTGKAGRHALPHLKSKGYDLLNVDLAPSEHADIKTLIADLTDSGQAFNALTTHFGLDRFDQGRPPSPPDAVVHFAAIPRVLIEPDNETFRVNTISTYNVIEAAAKLGVRKIVIASSETTYGVCFAEGAKDFHSFPLEEDYDVDPMDSYGLSKVVNEKTARAFAMRYGIDIYALRIGNVIEPRQSRVAQTQRLQLYRRPRPRRDRASGNPEGRARLSGLQRGQRHHHRHDSDKRGAQALFPRGEDHPRPRRIRSPAVQPQGARSARLQGSP